MPYLGNIPSPIILQDVLGNYNFDYGTLYIDSVNNRVGIGTSSPTSTFTVEGGVTEIRSGGYLMLRPTANDWDFRLQSLSGNKIGIFSGGDLVNPVATFVNGGNVGIGTSSPTKTLTIGGVGDQYINRSVDNGSIIVSGGIGITAGQLSGGFVARGETSSYNQSGIEIYANGVERLRITSAGNVGIGTSSPSSLLHVKHPSGNLYTRFEGYSNSFLSKMYISSISSGDGGIQYDGNNNTMDIFSYGDMKFNVGTGNISGSIANERMRITSAGNVGIGTASPSYTLDVNGSARSDYILFGSNSSAPTADAAIYRPANGTLGLVTNSSERMRITSAGNIYFGTTTDLGLTTRLSISYTGAGSMYGIVMKPTSSGSTYALYMYNSAGSFVGGINPTDSVTNYVSASDYRLKENVVALNDPIERLKQLLPRRFNFKNTPNNTVDGFIAHEVSSIVPEAVIGEKDQIDKNGNPVYQAMDNSKLVPLLTASIQKAIEKIEMLESRIQQLETN